MDYNINEFNNDYGDDFYNFINKRWLSDTNIPNDYQRWGTFQMLESTTLENIKNILEKSKITDDKFIKVLILYKQFNDIVNRSKNENYVLLSKIIKSINDQTSISSLFSLLIEYDIEYGINIPINFIIQSSFTNANYCILHLISGGLGLPDRDYYFLESKEEIRNKYIDFIKQYCMLFNIDIDPLTVFEIEKKLAEKSFNKQQKRNVDLINNTILFSQFISSHPNLKFLYKLFEKANKKPGQVNITNLEYMIYLNSIINTIELTQWKQYFIFHILLEFNFFLSVKVEQTYWNFYSQTLKGTLDMKSLCVRSIENTSLIIGELVGLLYVSKHFSSESKKVALDIVNVIKDELKQYLVNNDWMEQETKNKAIKKLEYMKIKIGYPDVIIKNYSLLDISSTHTLTQNILNAKKFHNKYLLANLYANIDRNKWYMNAHSINAYYSPNMNEIVFPAGILQEPFFSIKQDIAYNFGGFGMVIGHEITHGFDDEGSKFDADGNLNNWWSKNDFVKYKEKTDNIEKQYNQYTIENHQVNGKLTLGENIADIGGLSLSYNAFKKYMQCDKNKNRIYICYANQPSLNFTPEQKFFINFANVWKSKGRSQDIQQKILLDVHSPPIFRVNGSVRNIDAFYEVFNIKPTDKLYLKPEDRIKIWS